MRTKFLFLYQIFSFVILYSFANHLHEKSFCADEKFNEFKEEKKPFEAL